jgi:MFS family permease
MWRVGFFFHEMAFGLLSIFLPLYIIAIGGSLVDVGIMSSVALFVAIPFSYIWGYACDKTRRYKRYILLSFFALTFILYLFTLTTNLTLLILLYIVMWMFHVAHEAPKNVLIAELYPRSLWGKSFAIYEALAKIGWLSGLFLGFMVSTFGVEAKLTLLLCSALNLAAFVSSILLVTDPSLIFERGLVKIEKTLDFTYRGIALASKLLDGIPAQKSLRGENPYAFCVGLILFSSAVNMLSTPLPVFFSKYLSVPANLVFAIFILNSLGGVAGYLLTLYKFDEQKEKTRLSKIVLYRGVLAFLLTAVVLIPFGNLALASLILTLLGFTHALYLVYTLSISMEIIPEGKAGLFNVLTNIGGAFGSFVGPFIAQTMNYIYVFPVAGGVFFLSYIALKIFR